MYIDRSRSRNRVIKSSTLTHLAGEEAAGVTGSRASLLSETLPQLEPAQAAPEVTRAEAEVEVEVEVEAEADVTLPLPMVAPPLMRASPGKVPSSALSTPRSAPSDGEHYSLGLAHTDETSQSEQAWDPYLVSSFAYVGSWQ